MPSEMRSDIRSEPIDFLWPRGDGTRWRIVDSALGFESNLVYAGDFGPPYLRVFRPLRDAPQMFEDFAEIGRQSLIRGAAIGAEVEALMTPSDRPPLSDELTAIYAVQDEGVRRPLLRALREYGPLSITLSAVPVGDIIRDAFRLYDAERRLLRLQEFGDEPTRPGEIPPKWFDLLREIAGRVHIRHTFAWDAESQEPIAATHCDNLLDAMWWQLYEAVAGRRQWVTCQGCSRLFSTTDPRKKNHNSKCRHSAVMRKRYRSKGGSK